MDLSCKLFLKSEKELIFGPGRRELLLAIEELGSLRKAAQKLGMSYRWAWGRISAAEKALGVPLLIRTDKPLGGRPKVLTLQAKELLVWYTNVEKTVEATLIGASATAPSFLLDRLYSGPQTGKEVL